MAVSRTRSTELPSKWKDDNTPDTTHSPDHTALTATANKKTQNDTIPRKLPVVYYLSRNGHLEHPHFIEVPLLSSPHGLYLKDVINRLNVLRGNGMASLYSWSCKRSYKSGFVWHDLAEDDFIYPANGQEYVLKGSELLLDHSSNNHLEPAPSQDNTAHKSMSSASSSSSDQATTDFPAIRRRRNQSWSSVNLNEYKVYKADKFSESARRLAADASTQTEDKRRRRRDVKVKKEEEIEQLHDDERGGREEEIIEISPPPPSDSSPETLESLLKADGRLVLLNNNKRGAGGGSIEGEGLNQTVDNCGRIKASTVLMQLISCGSMSFRDCGATAVKEQGLSLIGQYKERLPHGGGRNHVGTSGRSFSGVKLEDKEYFSGSLIETKKKEELLVPSLKRSNSYNADQRSQLQLGEEEIEGVRTKCIPRRSRAAAIPLPAKKLENNAGEHVSSSGSKRFDQVHRVEKEINIGGIETPNLL